MILAELRLMIDELFVYGIAGECEPSVVAGCRGVGQQPVGLVHANGLTAMVSSYRPSDREASAPAKSPPKEDILAWHGVLDVVYAHTSILPTRYGMVASTAEEVQALLERNGVWLRKRLTYLANKGEFDITLEWNSTTVANEVAGQLEEIKELRAKGGSITQAEALHAGRLVFEAVEKRRRELARTWWDPLVKCAVQAREVRRGPHDILSAAFLVERERFTPFEQQIAGLSKGVDASLRTRYGGPLPPYSFVGLSLVMLTPERVEWARSLLQLGTEASIGEIRSAYRRGARTCHPDLHPGDEGAVDRFREIGSAYECLLGLANAVASDDTTRFPVRHESGACCAVVATEAG